MKQVFLEGLPRWETIKNKGMINWIESARIKAKVKFIYKDIEGEVEIVDYKPKGQHLYIKYLDKEPFKITTTCFQNCGLGKLLGIISNEYRYKIGDTLTEVNSGKLKILEQLRIKKSKWNEKGYKYQCLKCGNIDDILEGSLNRHVGCNVCSNQKVLVGYNDMWTTNPNLAKLLENPEDGYKYMQNSTKRVDWKCPNCGNIIKNKKIGAINHYGLSCSKCGDGISYPEKFMFNILEQLEIDFLTQLSKATFKWCGKYFYDFYISNMNCIIETHGSGHYTKTFETCGGKTLEKEQENDKIKKELALQNGIKEENYIIIDCKYSELEYIKSNIMNSELPKLLSFKEEDINWLKCHEYACKSRVKEICNLWNDGIKSTIKISKISDLCQCTIIKFLKKGAKLGWCDYDANKAKKDGQRRNDTENNKRKVICLNNNIVYKSMAKAERETNSKGIGTCCNNQGNYSGTSSIGEYLQWQYYDDYLINPKKLLSNDEIDRINNALYDKYRKQIICLNNKQKFNSIKEAEKFYNIQHIGACCNGKQKTAGKDPNTGEKLYWMYYEDYLKLNKNINSDIN